MDTDDPKYQRDFHILPWFPIRDRLWARKEVDSVPISLTNATGDNPNATQILIGHLGLVPLFAIEDWTWPVQHHKSPGFALLLYVGNKELCVRLEWNGEHCFFSMAGTKPDLWAEILTKYKEITKNRRLMHWLVRHLAYMEDALVERDGFLVSVTSIVKTAPIQWQLRPDWFRRRSAVMAWSRAKEMIESIASNEVRTEVVVHGERFTTLTKVEVIASVPPLVLSEILQFL